MSASGQAGRDGRYEAENGLLSGREKCATTRVHRGGRTRPERSRELATPKRALPPLPGGSGGKLNGRFRRRAASIYARMPSPPAFYWLRGGFSNHEPVRR